MFAIIFRGFCVLLSTSYTFFQQIQIFLIKKSFPIDFFAALPPSRFGEPPLPALPLPSGDDELFSPPGNGELSPNCCGDVSPTFEKPSYREMEKTMDASRFVAQHVKNKDKFESVSWILFAL